MTIYFFVIQNIIGFREENKFLLDVLRTSYT